MGSDFGKALWESIIAALIVALVLGGCAAVALWELAWFLWRHMEFNWA